MVYPRSLKVRFVQGFLIGALLVGVHGAPSPVEAATLSFQGFFQSLRAQVGGSVQTQAKATSTVSAKKQTFCRVFNRDLSFGKVGEEVLALKTALGLSGFPTEKGNMFDEDVAAALVSFQTKYGIRASGYFGSLTRTKMNELYKCAPGVSATSVKPTPAPKVIAPGAAKKQALKVLSPQVGDVWFLDSSYAISWVPPTSGDFDYYEVLLGNKLAPGILSGGPVFATVSKELTSTTFDPKDLSENLLKSWVANSNGASEGAVSANFFFVVKAIKKSSTNDDKGGSLVAEGKSGIFHLKRELKFIEVLSPNGGESFNNPEHIPLSFKTNLPPGTSYIVTLISSDRVGTTVAGGKLGDEEDGVYDLNVPIPSHIGEGEYKIDVCVSGTCDGGSKIGGESDAYFSITITKG